MSAKSIDNAKQPQKSDLMLLLQKARITHVVEFIDNEVYRNDSNEWSIYRIVKALWMPPEGYDWKILPHQQKFFGSDYVVGDGAAHDLTAENKMPKFHHYWDEQGGLESFQCRIENLLLPISLTSE